MIVLGIKECADHSLVVQGVKNADALIKQFWDTANNADYFGRQGIVIEKRFRELSFANPGTFLISKEDAIAGGNSEPRNEKIFNIFALVRIGERSGAGLSDLYCQWEKYGFPSPVIEEKFDPDRTVIRIAVEVGQNGLKVGQKVGQKMGQKTCQIPTGLPASAKQVLLSIREDSTFTHRGLASKLGFAETTIDKAFALLIRRGLLRRVGPKKGGHWEFVTPQPQSGARGS